MTDGNRKIAMVALLAALALRGCVSGGVVPAVGPRSVVLVYESADNTPEFAAMVLDLRDGEAAKYLTEKKHSLTVIDRDAPDPNGDRSKLLAKWQSEITETPIVLVLDQGRTKLVGKAPIDKNGPSSAVVDVVKRYGG